MKEIDTIRKALEWVNARYDETGIITDALAALGDIEYEMKSTISALESAEWDIKCLKMQVEGENARCLDRLAAPGNDARELAENAFDAWKDGPTDYRAVCQKYGQGDMALKAAAFIAGYTQAAALIESALAKAREEQEDARGLADSILDSILIDVNLSDGGKKVYTERKTGKEIFAEQARANFASRLESALAKAHEEERERCEDIVCAYWPDQAKIRAAIKEAPDA